ncbi:MAG: methyl-accepting chemotaxis protein [Aliarcobacter skirrowii]|uniref:methyl-accepting chemotaxis protein n=1 Tax=Aliarcobacter skirrowii TaxID=28200 RepID=UPI002432D5CF|nr:methyl-accepting chemotaxis protein [Aliarcobacter skirrowii]MDD2509265.1 methyl-accepting chemotaxis protein [Aliarcobacter skirrowii]MDD3496166.1 methyl-accepting chemotaxis protein [Aliarcobacter skirrowii]
MFKNMLIRRKLFSLFIMPLFVVIFLLGLGITILFYEYQNATKAASIDEIKKVGNLIHELQIERGLSAGFVASNGQNNKEALINQRKKVDSSFDDLLQYQRRLNINIANKILNDLKNKREAINSISLNANQSSSYFTGIIYDFFEYYRNILFKSEVTSIKNQLLAHYWIIFGKENLGQLRANLNATFTINEFRDDTFAKVGANKTIFETAFKNFEVDANKQIVNYFKTKYQGADVLAIKNMMDIAFTKNKEGNFDISAQEWFTKATIVINILKEVEDFSINFIEEEMNNKISTIINYILLFCIIGLIILISTIFLFIKISSNIVGSTKNLQTGLLNFFSYLNREENSVKTLDDSAEDEFGQMSKVVNQNIIKTKKGIEEDRRLIDETIAVLGEFEQGDLCQRLNIEVSNPALTQLKNVLNNMASNLESNIDNVLSVLEQYSSYNYLNKIDQKGLKEHLLKLASGVNSLGDSITSMLKENKSNGLTLDESSNLLLTNVDKLNLSSNEAAASLEETAAALEQITSNIRNNTNSIAQMASFSKNVTASALQGETLANQTTTAMEEINTQVSAINEAISVIDQIAFQTNILSLNAAVEAATAGESGKGFAVVAQEVRNLANRSAEAANEIKSIVENATSKANEGKQIANSMIEGYKELNTNISKTMNLISDIQNASNEQLLGIEQINDAVNSLDQQTQQNAMIASQTHDVAILTDEIAKLVVKDANDKEFIGKNDVKAGPFIILCQLGKIKNTKGHKDENRNRCRAIC